MRRTIVFLGRVTLAAGVFAIAAAIWRSARGKCWLLALNGLALGALGLILNGIFGFRISLRTIALLVVVMAMSTGMLELVIARTMRRQRHAADEWVLGFAGAVSVLFAAVFFALAFHWIKMEPGSSADMLWLGSYFGFSGIGMVALALLLGLSESGQWAVAALGNPKKAH